MFFGKIFRFSSGLYFLVVFIKVLCKDEQHFQFWLGTVFFYRGDFIFIFRRNDEPIALLVTNSQDFNFTGVNI